MISHIERASHEAEKERDRERQRETERDRERKRETERDRERQTETETHCGHIVARKRPTAAKILEFPVESLDES